MTKSKMATFYPAVAFINSTCRTTRNGPRNKRTTKIIRKGKMLDGDKPKSEEERLEEIKFEIKSLFNDLEPEVSDFNLKEELDSQRRSTIDLASQTEETNELSAEIKTELFKYFKLLEKIEENHFLNYNNYEVLHIKIAISHIRMYYELGKINIALDLLDDPENPDAGAESQSRNISDRTEENAKIYNDIRRLTDLFYELVK